MGDAASQLNIRLLGTPEVRVAGRTLVLHQHKARSLLYYLAATGRTHTRDHLAALLWSDSPESNARHSLRSSLYHLRQALQDQQASAALIGESDLISLRLDSEACDVTQFRCLLADGSEEALAEAITLYHGSFLQGSSADGAPLFEEWLRFERNELEQVYVSALRHLVSWTEEREDWEQAISYMQRIVQLDPLAEETQQRLIKLFLRAGAAGQARRQFETFETVLEHELGLAPSSETRALLSAVPAAQHSAFKVSHDPAVTSFINISPAARTLLEVLAVADQPLPHTLLREFPGIDGKQLAAALAELAARKLVIDMKDEQVAITHDPLREALLQQLSHLRRQDIHYQLARIIEQCPSLQEQFPVRQIALHAVAGQDSERARRFGMQILDELVQDNASAQTAAFLRHLYDLLAPTAASHEMLRLTAALGEVHQSSGQLEEAVFWRRRHLELAGTIADPTARTIAHFELGALALVANDYQSAASSARAGLAIKLPAEHPQRAALTARGHWLLGAALAMEGKALPQAEHNVQQAAAAHRLTGNIGDLCVALFELGNIAAQRGELSHALELYQEAARAAEAARDHYFLALAYNNFAYHSLLLGRLADAQQSCALGEKLADRYNLTGALMHLASTRGEIHLYLGEWQAAGEMFQRSLTLAEELHNLERQAGNRAGLALAERGLGNLAQALVLFDEALSLLAEQGYWHIRTRIQLWLAETLLLNGDSGKAASHLKVALSTARAHDRKLLLLQGERLSAALQAARGDVPAANALFTRVLERATNLRFPLEIARAQAAWGLALARYASLPHDGYNLLSAAREAFASLGALAELQSIADTIHVP